MTHFQCRTYASYFPLPRHQDLLRARCKYSFRNQPKKFLFLCPIKAQLINTLKQTNKIASEIRSAFQEGFFCVRIFKSELIGRYNWLNECGYVFLFIYLHWLCLCKDMCFFFTQTLEWLKYEDPCFLAPKPSPRESLPPSTRCCEPPPSTSHG